jgi:hypothetical protein
MKNILVSILFILACTFSHAQSPEKMTFQAVIRDAGNALVTNSTVGMQFSILQSTATGSAVYIETHSVATNANGLATVEIGLGNVVTGSFSSIDWANGPYFIKTETDPTGGTAYTISGTTQFLSVPYALYAKEAGNSFSGNYNDLTNQPVIPTNNNQLINGQGFITSPNDADSDPNNEIQDLQISGQSLTIVGGNTITLPAGANTLDQAYDQGGAGSGRIINADAGEVEIQNSTANGIGLRATTTNSGVGILSTSTNPSNAFSPIQATTNSTNTLVSAIIGSSSGGAYGVSGQIESTGTGTAGIYGNNLRTTGGYGTYGIGHSGVVGETNYQLGFGVYGRNYDAIGPLGNAVGTYGMGYVGVWGDQTDVNGFSVYANGDFGAAGTKAFYIDHPQDPENKYLRHFSIESDEVINLYRGTVAFDSNGEAVVEMPAYFESVNTNFSYQLTPVGGYAPLYIKEKMKDGKFVIAGGAEGLEVSWVVHAERNDPYLEQNPNKRNVEVEKEDWNKGKYLQPQLYNQSDDLKIVKPLPEEKEIKTQNIVH